MKLVGKHSNNDSKYLLCSLSILSGLVTTTLITGLLLSSSLVSADDNVVDKVNITVPVSCAISATGTNSHNATINNGQYNSAIGETIMKALCNDNEGFAIYAVGFTDNEAGKNVLSNSTLGSSYDIATGIAISGNTSNWAMKLASTPGAYAPIVAGSSADTEKESGDPDFTSFQAVPNRYAKVAYRTSSTDAGTNAEGSILTTTYQAFISSTQPAGTYSGKVKYTMIHPNDANAPITHPAVLDTGKTINSKLKSLAATVVNGEDTTITPDFNPEEDDDWNYAYDEYIKSIAVHLETPTPASFVPSEKNTISTSDSQNPIYIDFDNTNDAGIMHFYTKGEQIILPADSSFMFYLLAGLAEIPSIADWNTTNVTNMRAMFYGTGYSATSFSINLSSWDTSNVTDMYRMFWSTGESATTWSIGDLSSWNTTNVTNMNSLFAGAGQNATVWSIGDLSSWDTSNVTDMSDIFYQVAEKPTTWSIGDLSSWDTSNVTDMSGMFCNAGYNATNWSIGDISSWNTSSVINMANMFCDAGSSVSTFSLDLSSWDTSNVTDMSGMFAHVGYNASSFSLDLSNWNTANVTNMFGMFDRTGQSATTWSITIPSTNGNSINNAASRLYGKTTSIYGTLPSGRSFTLAQP